MNPELDAVIDANRNLTKKITELEGEVKELYPFKERFIRLEGYCDDIKKQLAIKRTSVRVLELRKDGNQYVLQVQDIQDSPGGMIIKVTNY